VVTMGQKGPAAVLRMRFVDANSGVDVIGLNRVAGHSNYFVGQDPRAWLTDIVNYAKAEYRGVYPGTDLIFHGEDGRLEYDFLIAPKSDPRAIRLSFSGAEGIELDDAGDLLLHAAGATLRQHRPF